MLKKAFQFLFLIFGCIHLAGGPYALIQAYAWANMIVSYSQEGSLGEAVTDTFSGKKPCALCKKIQRVERSDTSEKNGKEPLAPVNTNLFQDLFPVTLVALKCRLSAPFPCPDFASPGDPSSPPLSGPPAPPPRC